MPTLSLAAWASVCLVCTVGGAKLGQLWEPLEANEGCDAAQSLAQNTASQNAL